MRFGGARCVETKRKVIKSGARIVAIEDAPFSKGDKKVLAVGVVARRNAIEGILSFYVRKDGNDATKKIARKIEHSRFMSELKLVAINGIAMAGLNIVDIIYLSKRLGMPVVAITRRKPHSALMKKAIRASGLDVKRKLLLIGKIQSERIARIDGFYVQFFGAKEEEIRGMINIITENLRLAHMIASGIARGESRGRI